jgi:microcystin degradation protein MlrC
MRVAVASVLQETNTFSLRRCSLADFSIARAATALEQSVGTNSEMAGAVAALETHGATAIPIVRAWAMPSGPVTSHAFDTLRDLLGTGLAEAGGVDGLVLSLHGAMVAEGHQDADSDLIATAREALGPGPPIAISLDLHANVTQRMVDSVDGFTAYHTDPHVDMKAAGMRAADQVLAIISGTARPSIALAKRPMLLPAETMNTTLGPLADVRAAGLADAPDSLIDLSIFPVQPWLDVAELGLGVVAVVDSDPRGAKELAERVASEAWDRRHDFVIDRMFEPRAAIERAAASHTRPFIIAESADAPTAGATGDSPVMVEALLRYAPGLAAYVPIVDPQSVDVCHVAGVGARVDLSVGAKLDTRWWTPVAVTGTVRTVGAGAYRLEGAGFTGMEVTMGRFAVVDVGSIRLLISERPAWTSDPATFRYVGLPIGAADVVVVRSCSDFRPNYPPSSTADAITLDVPGTATPRLENLEFEHAPRPLYPIDP